MALNERQLQVLEAVIESYVRTAEPAGSRTISKLSGLGLSPASIRNIMSDLEELGYLYHPHTSAGRIPTDRAYRLYVDAMMRPPKITASHDQQLREELATERTTALDQILGRAAKVLGLLTNELGVAVTPTLDAAVLERLELLQVSTERLMLVLTLKSGVVRTIFVEVPSHLAPDVLVELTLRINERLAGLSLRDIRASLSDRLRDMAPDPTAGELVNIFIQEAGELFDVPGGERESVLLGSTRQLTDQPEFATKESLQGLIGVTERRDLLREALATRMAQGVTVTIGSEHTDPTLAPFTLVTSAYRTGPLSGVIGVMGPTRMPYDKIVALVDHTSRLVGDLLQ
jgi:heat-inducible transcriptional repressor